MNALHSERIRWLLIDDHAMFADALSIVLSLLRPSLKIDTATTTDQAIKRLQHTHYSLIILDLQMPECINEELYMQIKQAEIDNVMICSATFQPQKALALRKLGLRGYITKDADAADILAFADRITDGESWVCSPHHQQQLEHYESSRTLLTERQIHILQLLESGATTKQVAHQLCLSENTIKTHVRLMLDKLNVSNRSQCITRARGLNLLSRH
ncbi:LuxR C-terminal-related transcriptional regulator [Marinomonas algarum]|uniref:Response regulator transcription factor n=1 Tax=Marinomonas algarum TaxID=2883105 RepID=A0A9X1IPV9_9GAMM|nr:response regulator transcription factor [Marinomonas algarum]